MPLASPRFRNNVRLQQASVNSPPLKQGETSEAVEILQQALIDLGFPMPVSTLRKGMPDGIFGPETEATVKHFQTANILTVDGVAGQLTLGRLDAIYQAREAAEKAKLFVEVNTPSPVGPWHVD